MKGSIKIESFIEVEDMLDYILEYIEDAENTKMIYKISKWLGNELEAWEFESEDNKIQQSVKVLNTALCKREENI